MWRSNETAAANAERFAISWTRSSDAGRPVVCGSCPDCGVRTTHRAEVYRGFTSIRARTLDERAWLKPTISFWTTERQPWVQIPEGLTQYDGQPQ